MCTSSALFVLLWAMMGGKELLLLAAFLSVVTCQQKPTVTMSPSLRQVFIGDMLFLTCADSSSASAVKWTLNNNELESRDRTLKIAAAAPKDSGSYKCQINMETSNSFSLTVLEFAPSASLTIKTGHPVVPMNMMVILSLETDEGLEGWSCKAMKGEVTNKIVLKVKDNPVRLDFDTHLSVPETIFWCTDQMETCRSNQVTIRTSDKRVSLEMYPLPAVAGQSLSLRCLVWGTNKIIKSVFYKNDSPFQTVESSHTYKIDATSDSEVGQYKCVATYKYVDQTIKTPHEDTSDPQEVSVHASPVRAELSDQMGCSCSSCDSSMKYRYYKKTDDSWKMLGPSETPDSSGTYRCRAVKNNMRTLPSRSMNYGSFPSVTVVVVALLVVMGLVVLIVACIFYKKRHSSGPVYEDVGLRLPGDAKESEYDTIQLGEASSSEKRGGEYEGLKKEEIEEAAYHTVGKEGAPGEEVRYQELNIKQKKEDTYHTLGEHGAAGGHDGYEALKKELQKGEYETLETKEAGGRPERHGLEEIDENKDKSQ